jgi:hypothetical protein
VHEATTPTTVIDASHRAAAVLLRLMFMRWRIARAVPRSAGVKSRLDQLALRTHRHTAGKNLRRKRRRSAPALAAAQIARIG